MEDSNISIRQKIKPYTTYKFTDNFLTKGNVFIPKNTIMPTNNEGYGIVTRVWDNGQPARFDLANAPVKEYLEDIPEDVSANINDKCNNTDKENIDERNNKLIASSLKLVDMLK